MALPAENILLHLFGTTNFSEVSESRLDQAVKDFPYYSAAHFLKAKRNLAQDESAANKVLQEAALHFSNERWYHFSLHQNDRDTGVEEIFIEIPTGDDFTKDEEEGVVEELTETDELVNEKLSSILQSQADEFHKPIEVEAEIPVENVPYHRVDYFDSQGIKLEEEKANDKLGTQLRKFTDWLKQMKRANSNSAELETDEAGESKVKNIAEHSNEQGEVVTEAMAEVLAKQGKPEQAVQIYQKLSFNNPSKSAYFAAKIEELKDKQ